ncbi:hypothetical protein F8M41_022135 [Gigaspora margarita]|uniref:Uncharacterized protein n=1 Tax=Gigaspora margarita TaxID=4874 RepID=A0A8H4AFK9_GIGMA|nr:hypothetical protein F8M41_022135 [Gigaspora margarita]
MKFKSPDRFTFLISLSIIFIGFIASISARPLSFDIGEVSQPSKRALHDNYGKYKRGHVEHIDDCDEKDKREAQDGGEGEVDDGGSENEELKREAQDGGEGEVDDGGSENEERD